MVVEQDIPVQLQWWFDEVLDQVDNAFLESSMEDLKERRIFISPSDEDEVRLKSGRKVTERRNRYVQNVAISVNGKSLLCVTLHNSLYI